MISAGIPPAKARTRFIGGIDGLRAFAVLSVLFYHLDATWLPTGYVGVDIFFVISGFVVAHSVYDSGKTSFTGYFLWFYRRRFSRILPALFAFVLIIGLLNLLLLPASPATKLIEMTGVGSIVGASNFVLLWRAGDYFSAATEFNSFTHTWSLAVEEQYYLLFPFISYFLIVRRAQRPAMRRAALALTWILCLGSMALAWHLTASWRDFAFYMLPTRFWELGLGLLLRCQLDSWANGRAPKLTNTVTTPIAVAALAALIASFWITPAGAFPFPAAILPCAATAVLIAIVWLYPRGIVDRLLNLPAMRFVGRISYSLYLWHWGVIVLMRWTTGLDTPLLKLAALIAMFALAIGSYWFVEQPLRHSSRLKRFGTTAFFAGYAGAGAALGAVCVALILARPVAGLSATNDRAVWDPYALPAATACGVSRSEQGLAGGKEIAFTPQCGAQRGPRVFIVGDSHAGAYERMAFLAASSAQMEVRVLSRGGCPILDGAFLAPRPECRGFLDQVHASLKAHARPGDVLLIAALYTPRFRDEWGDLPPASAPGAPVTVEAARAIAERELTPYRQLGLHIVLEAPKPTIPTALFRCADATTHLNPYCARSSDVPRAEMLLRRSKPLAVLAAVAASTPGVVVWDPFPVLCPGPVCRGYEDGRPLYFDTDHLTGYANERLLPDFLKTIRNLPPAPSAGAAETNAEGR